MTSETVYQTKITALDHAGLRELWLLIRARQTDTADWAPGKAFEYLVLRAFELDGAAVTWPYSVRIGTDEIEQIDGAVYVDGLACLVESKDFAEAVNVAPLAKLRNQLLRRPAGTLGLVFSTYGFTDPAVTLAQFTAPQAVLLWEGSDVDYALQQPGRMRAGLALKYRRLVEYGLARYKLTVEELP